MTYDTTPSTPAAPRPLIRHNDYSPLTPPEVGQWTPTLPVSVIVPVHGGQHRLDLTLAALAAQTYPAHLTEVIVVDDGSEPPILLPEIRPENTRLVYPEPGTWGISHAVNTGVSISGGEVIQRVDADMVLCRDHLEALLRWHHVCDYVVTIGGKRFVEEPEVTAAEVHAAVAADTLDKLFDLEHAVPSSTEETIRRLDGLKAAKNPYNNCTGPTLSLRRWLFDEIGGLDPEVLRGGDTEFAYRLAMAGAVFVPDLSARAAHLGMPAQRLHRERVVRTVEPYLAHRVPLRRDLRKERGRRWLVPYVEVVYEVAEAGEPQVRAAVEAALTGSLPDVAVTLVAPWSRLPRDRHSVLDAPDFELRVLRSGFAHDDRVRLADAVPPTPAPTPYRYSGPLDVPPAPRTLERMIDVMLEERLGLLVAEFPDGRQARLARSDAVNRARLLAGPEEDLDAVLDQTHGVRRVAAAEFWEEPKPAPKPAPRPAETAAAPPAAAAPARRRSWFGRLRRR